MSGSAPDPPIFVLSHARTGSTLLRYLLDAHPQVCCPPELALARLCRDLTYTLSLTMGIDADAQATDVAVLTAAVRSHVERIMTDYRERRGKQRWCDKSTNNVEHLDVLARVFPDAQFICLHRHGLDVVHSLLELFRFGYTGQYARMVAKNPESTIDAMIDTWTEATAAILDFEVAHPEQCLRVRYEDFVAAPTSIAERLFGFLGLSGGPDAVARMFDAPHEPGPGDFKVQFTREIKQTRTGRGNRLPRSAISSARLSTLNGLHGRLGYPPVSAEPAPQESLLNASDNVSRSIRQGHWG
jgi:hypothetical protein